MNPKQQQQPSDRAIAQAYRERMRFYGEHVYDAPGGWASITYRAIELDQQQPAAEGELNLARDGSDLHVQVFMEHRPGGMHVGIEEVIVKATHLPTGRIAYGTGERSQHANRAKAIAALAEAPAKVGEWVLFPREPTAEILLALSHALGIEPLGEDANEGYPITGQQSTVRQYYAALIAAAPAKVAVSDAVVAEIARKLRKLRLTDVGGRKENPAATVKGVLKSGLGGFYDDGAVDYIVRATLRCYEAAINGGAG